MPSFESVFKIDKVLSAIKSAGIAWSPGMQAWSKGFEEVYGHWLKALSNDSSKVTTLQQHMLGEQQRLMQILEQSSPPGRLLSEQDKRFNGEAWQSVPAFRYLAESYLTACRLMMEGIESAELEPTIRQRMRFFVKQYLDAVSPANFLLTNPEALRSVLNTQGESLRHGLENLQADIHKGHISMTDEAAFKVGENLAITPGKVVFENEIFQLIQYAPSTDEVFLRPLLIVPPCINKFYILDLRPDNSYIAYVVKQGFTVLVISWRNVGLAQRQLTWDDYLANGVVKAIDVTRLITQVEKINVLGFCVGGTLLGSALAVLRRMGHDVVESVTFLTTFLDFTDVGEIAAYIDEAFVERREQEVGKGGIVKGGELAFAFSSLRANDLVWNYVVNNYLKGDKPPAFDLLFWNSDSTNLPGPWYCYYLRNTYFENNLIKPDYLTMCGVPVDLAYIDMPAYVLATREDHIVPWHSAYASATHLSGKIQFVLGASGHIAGVINPAAKNKRSYWYNAAVFDGEKTAEAWLQEASEVEGSWWPHWVKWLKQYGGRMIAARTKLGSAQYQPAEPAPGRYVQEKS